MKEYNKEKLHDYVKELFAMCLVKKLYITYNGDTGSIYIYNIGNTHICKGLFKFRLGDTMPIWELIEKVKRL